MPFLETTSVIQKGIGYESIEKNAGDDDER